MINKTKFKDLFIFKNKSFKDKRGYFKELIKEKQIKKKLPFTVMSYSKKNVIRGLHLQTKKPQAKFITVLSGKIFDVAVDCRIKSKTFGEYFSFILSENKNESLYIPEGFAHGYCSLSDKSLIHYKMSNYRYKNFERGIIWDDKDINIKWPTKNPIISLKDKQNISLNKCIKLL